MIKDDMKLKNGIIKTNTAIVSEQYTSPGGKEYIVLRTENVIINEYLGIWNTKFSGRLRGVFSTPGLNSALFTEPKNFTITWTISSPGLMPVVLSLVCAICKGLQCDLERHYQLVQNKTSTEVLRCPKCRSCKSGLELQPPCGTFVLRTDILRNCTPCKDGYYSAKDDMLPCQRCQSETCLPHQNVVGICKKDQPDTSRCAGCKEGYIMNSDGTACEVDKPDIMTTMPPTVAITNSPTVSNITDGETGLSRTDIIPIIVIPIVIFLIILIIGLCCYLRRHRNLRITETGKDVESTPSTSNTTLDETRDEQKETLIMQDKDHHNGPLTCLTSHGPHMKETTAGFAKSKKSNNIEIKVSDAVMDESRSAMSSGYVMQIPKPASAVMSQNSCSVNDPLLARFGDLPARIYNEICETFDSGAPGIDWKALAGWLDLKTEDVKRIEIKESNKTDEVIKRWEIATENTVAKFVQILENNNMTYLADQIKSEIQINLSLRTP